uniref:Superoxide dismutase copper chaperone n=2 Tax=Aegilops tauschii subsp. strangulata TaxID=200361 RepID=A0A453CLB8_AEGTS
WWASSGPSPPHPPCQQQPSPRPPSAPPPPPPAPPPPGSASPCPPSPRSPPPRPPLPPCARRPPPLRWPPPPQPISLPPTRLGRGTALPELTTEFMVDMKCEGCVTAVKNRLQTLEGIQNIEVDLNNQVVRVRGSLPVKIMLDALHQTGRDARLIGQGNPDDFLVSAAVAEFKGPVIFGVVRLAQVNMELARIEATFSGLSPGKHGWSINEFGDLTKGAESTGKVYNPQDYLSDKPLGDLGTLEAGENGEAQFSGSKEKLKVVDLIGRSIALYATEDRSDPGIAAAVVARSAGVGENYKKLCTCDGVTIWESS